MRYAISTKPTRGGIQLPFIGYLIGFHLLWTLYVLFGFPYVRALGEETLLYALVNLTVRISIWIVPVVVYMRRFATPGVSLQLLRHWRRGVAWGLAFTALNLLGMLARYGVPTPDPAALTWNSVLSTSLLIGFIEEVPYRGLMLNEFQARWGFWTANVATTLLFTAIHLPGWLSLGLFTVEVLIFVLVFGFLMGLLVRLSGSLWSAITAHSLNDLLNAVVFA
jgi:membrane protease YdiL (CAAX protease family)